MFETNMNTTLTRFQLDAVRRRKNVNRRRWIPAPALQASAEDRFFRPKNAPP